MVKVEDNTIDTHKATCGWSAKQDAMLRNLAAIDDHRDFFTDSEHTAKVEKVVEIVNNFFRVKKGVYVNYRTNRGKPFTAVKVDNPDFPNAMPRKERIAVYYKPLEDLGVEVKFSKGTNSYIFRVN